MKLNEFVCKVSTRIAGKTGLNFSTEDPEELRSFIEELVPALGSELSHDSASFEDFWKYYEDASWTPTFCANFDQKTAKLFHEDETIDSEVKYFGDEDDDGVETPDDAAGEMISAISEEGIEEPLSHLLKRFRIFSEKTHSSFEVTICNAYALGKGELSWTFSDGVMSGENTWVMEDLGGEDADLFLVNAWWIHEVFWGMSADECKSLGIDFEMRIAPGVDEAYPIKKDSAAYVGLLLRYNHAALNDLDVKDWTQLVERLPGVFPYLTEDIRARKDVALTAIRANRQYTKQYYAALDNSYSETLCASSSVVRGESHKFSEKAMLNNYCSAFPSSLMAEPEILIALADANMAEAIKPSGKDYNEKSFVEALKAARNKFGILYALYGYWKQKLADDAKTAEHIKRKYTLFSDAPNDLVAAYRCREILEAVPDSETLWLNLLSCGYLLNFDFWSTLTTASPDVLEKLKRTFRKMPEKEQNMVILHSWYEYAMLIKADLLDDGIAKLIAERCPNAAHILPEEYVLKFGLRADTELQGCTHCGRCMCQHIRLA